MGAADRDVEHLAAEHVGGADTSGDHGSSCAVDRCVGTLGPAAAEFHHTVARGGPDDAGSLRGDQALMVQNVQKRSLNQLGLHDGGDDFDQRFSREDHPAFRNRVDIAGEAEFVKILQKVLLENVEAPEIIDIILRKMQVLDIFDDLR